MIDFVYILHQVQKKRWSNDHLFSNLRFDCPFNPAEAREKKKMAQSHPLITL